MGTVPQSWLSVVTAMPVRQKPAPSVAILQCRPLVRTQEPSQWIYWLCEKCGHEQPTR